MSISVKTETLPVGVVPRTPVILLALSLHDVRFELRAGPWWQVAGIGIGTFFGILWVVALSEELFFRGVIERAMLDRSRTGAVLVSAVLYNTH